MHKVTIKNIIKRKGNKPITCLTAYTESTARIVGKYCDIVLVGDSVGMVLYGMKTTKNVDLKTMILHAKSVTKATTKSLVVVDMPYKTYNNKFQAFRNAKKIMKSTNCDAVKLEGGKKIIKIVEHLIKNKIPVMGHVGLLPQYEKDIFKVKGRSKLEMNKICNDANLLAKAGVFAIVIECVIENLAEKITKSIKIPTIGIGASKKCDGQILVIDDLIGMSNFKPKFVKKYANVSKIIEKCVKQYCYDVKKSKFPTMKNIYKKNNK